MLFSGSVGGSNRHVNVRAGELLSGQFEPRPNLHNSAGPRAGTVIVGARNGSSERQRVYGNPLFSPRVVNNWSKTT